MRNSRMLRLTREHVIQNLRGLLLSRIALIACNHSGSDQCQRVEYAGFPIGWIASVELFHRVAISKRAGAMVQFVVVLVKDFYRRDVILFALSLFAGSFCFLNCTPPLL